MFLAAVVCALAVLVPAWWPSAAPVVAQNGGAQAASVQVDGTLVTPLAGNWTLLVNLGASTTPAAIFTGLPQQPTAAFTYDPGSRRFRIFRPDLPQISDLEIVAAGEVFWVFIPASGLDGDLTFWTQPALERNRAVALQPGFNLVPWTGGDGVRIAQAVAGLPVQRVFFWDAQRQRYEVWDSALPPLIQNDFALEYGVGLWVFVDGFVSVTWEQA